MSGFPLLVLLLVLWLLDSLAMGLLCKSISCSGLVEARLMLLSCLEMGGVAVVSASSSSMGMSMRGGVDESRPPVGRRSFWRVSNAMVSEKEKGGLWRMENFRGLNFGD